MTRLEFLENSKKFANGLCLPWEIFVSCPDNRFGVNHQSCVCYSFGTGTKVEFIKRKIVFSAGINLQIEYVFQYNPEVKKHHICRNLLANVIKKILLKELDEEIRKCKDLIFC